MVKKPRDFGGIILNVVEREYAFKFKTASEMVQWYHSFQGVISKEIKAKTYSKRVKEQHEKLSNSNKIAKY